MTDTDTLRAAAHTSKAWPYEEARKILKRWPQGKTDAVLKSLWALEETKDLQALLGTLSLQA